MRELKFRWYDKKLKRMYAFELLKGASDGMVKICQKFFKLIKINSMPLEKGLYLPTEDPNLILMQYTGLKDKNGNEIYEGDILGFKEIIHTDCSKKEIEKVMDEALISIISYHPMASVIKVHKGSVRVFGCNREDKEALVLELRSEELEIVGNIYENPELMEVEK